MSLFERVQGALCSIGQARVQGPCARTAQPYEGELVDVRPALAG